MKALVKEEAGVSYTYTEVPVVPPQGDELLVKVGKVALCGSDISLYQWNNGEWAWLGKGGALYQWYKVSGCGYKGTMPVEQW